MITLKSLPGPPDARALPGEASPLKARHGQYAPEQYPLDAPLLSLMRMHERTRSAPPLPAASFS